MTILLLFLLVNKLPTVTPTVLSLMAISSNDSRFSLICTSTNSPATTVIWVKDGAMLSSSFLVHQILRDGVTATYDNVIEIGAAVDELPGTYSCSVLNSAGLSNVAILNIQGEAYTLNSKFRFYHYIVDCVLSQAYKLLEMKCL